MENAIKLYEEFMDLDFLDYEETFEKDIAFVQALIDELGIIAARNYLAQLMA